MVNMKFFVKKEGSRIKLKFLDYNTAVQMLNYRYCVRRVGNQVVIEMSRESREKTCRNAVLAYKTLIIPVPKDIMPDGVYVAVADGNKIVITL